MKTSKDNEYLENMVHSSIEAVPKYWWAVWMTLSTRDATIRCGRFTFGSCCGMEVYGSGCCPV